MALEHRTLFDLLKSLRFVKLHARGKLVGHQHETHGLLVVAGAVIADEALTKLSEGLLHAAVVHPADSIQENLTFQVGVHP